MILIINTGSSSIKYKLYDGEVLVKFDKVDRIGEGGTFENHAMAWEKLYQGLAVHREEIEVIGHRLVHGGEKYRQPIVLDKNNLKELEEIVSLAPLHLPPALEVVGITMTTMANVVQIAIFDTGFYVSLPKKVVTYPLPLEVREKYRIKKYGFHGISHSYALRKAQEDLGMIRTQRTISIHLGAGCSISAIKEGVCQDTSMGFTPMEGLMMTTRAGDMDNGIIIHLLRNGMSIDEVDVMLNKQSGILGVSGFSLDLRDVLYVAGYKVEDGKYTPSSEMPRDEATIEAARLAIEIFVHRIVKYIGGYIAVLGGLDAIVFTGTAGAGSEELRNMILNHLRFIDNYEILVVDPNEEAEMMLEIQRYLKSQNTAVSVEASKVELED